jgi:WD40 repeat protein
MKLYRFLVVVILLAFCRTSSAQKDGPKPSDAEVKKAEARSDVHGDPLPAGALARLGTMRFRSGLYYSGVALAPDGKTLAVGTSSLIRILDVGTGKEVRNFRGGLAGQTGLTFSPDGTALALADFGPLQLVDAANGQVKVKLAAPPQQRVLRGGPVSFSADGSIVATGSDSLGAANQKSFVFAWDTKTGKELGPFEVLQNYNTKAVVSADGKRLASFGQYLSRGGGNDTTAARTVQIWDVAQGKEIRRLQTETLGTITQAAFSPDGKTLAATAGQASIVMWDVESGKELRRVAGRRGLNLIRFSPDGKTLLGATMDGIILMWDSDGKRQGVCEGHGPVHSLVFLADGRILAAGVQGQAVRIWEVPSGKLLTPAGGHAMRLAHLGFSPDGKTLVSAAKDGKILFWDKSGKELRQLALKDDDALRYGGSNRLDALAISGDAKYGLSLSSINSGIRLWDLASGKVIADFEGFRGSSFDSQVVFSPDGGLFAVGDRQGQLVLWDAHSGQEKVRLANQQRRIGNSAAMAFSGDSKVLAIANTYFDNRPTVDVRLVNTTTGKEMKSLGNFQYNATPALALSHDGQVLALGTGGGLELWDTARGQKRKQLDGGQGSITALTFSPDGRSLAGGLVLNRGDTAQSELLIWELASGRLRARRPAHAGIIDRLAFAPDGRVLASGAADTSILLWDMTGKTLHAAPAAALTADEVHQHWRDLADSPERAFAAMGRLQWSPAEAGALLKGNLKVTQAKAPTEAAMKQMVRDLDDEKFAVREKAGQDLTEAGAAAVPILQKALQEQPAPSLEARRRIEALLTKLTREELGADEIRHVRAVEVLEHLGTTEAGDLLRALAGGAAARLTREAQAAVRRLGSMK